MIVYPTSSADAHFARQSNQKLSRLMLHERGKPVPKELQNAVVSIVLILNREQRPTGNNTALMPCREHPLHAKSKSKLVPASGTQKRNIVQRTKTKTRYSGFYVPDP